MCYSVFCRQQDLKEEYWQTLNRWLKKKIASRLSFPRIIWNLFRPLSMNLQSCMLCFVFFPSSLHTFKIKQLNWFSSILVQIIITVEGDRYFSSSARKWVSVFKYAEAKSLHIHYYIYTHTSLKHISSLVDRKLQIMVKVCLHGWLCKECKSSHYQEIC